MYKPNSYKKQQFSSCSLEHWPASRKQNWAVPYSLTTKTYIQNFNVQITRRETHTLTHWLYILKKLILIYFASQHTQPTLCFACTDIASIDLYKIYVQSHNHGVVVVVFYSFPLVSWLEEVKCFIRQPEISLFILIAKNYYVTRFWQFVKHPGLSVGFMTRNQQSKEPQ